MRSLSVTAVACIIAGYVLQVIGVSGMHYPVQVTLFGITIIMTGIRVVLRPTPSPLTARITRPKHEMDWLAVTQLFRPKDLISPEHKNHRPAPTWTINGGQTWRCSTHIPEEPSVNTTDLIYLRNKIGNECKWDSPGMEEVSHAIHAIETIARSLQKENLIPDSCSSISCSIPVDLGSKLRMENFTFCVKRDIEGGSNIWKVDSESDLSSALSLWLFYDKENTLTEERENDLSIFFLGSNERMHEVRNSWDSQPGLPAAQPDFCRRVRYVKITEDESSKSTYPGPQPVNVKRNMIAGFQEGLHLHPPNFHYNLHRATVQLDIETRDLSVHFADNVSENAQTKETSGAGDGNSAPAIVETANIAKLYARHLVSAFMWAIAQHISDAGRDIVSKKEFYKQLAGQVALTGLLDEEDALLVILPPLVQPRIIESSQLRPHNGSYQQGSHWWQK
jgi:hypothetical protein